MSNTHIRFEVRPDDKMTYVDINGKQYYVYVRNYSDKENSLSRESIFKSVHLCSNMSDTITHHVNRTKYVSDHRSCIIRFKLDIQTNTNDVYDIFLVPVSPESYIYFTIRPDMDDETIKVTDHYSYSYITHDIINGREWKYERTEIFNMNDIPYCS